MKFKANGNYGNRNANQAPGKVRMGKDFHSTADSHEMEPSVGGSSEQRTGPNNVTPRKLFQMRTIKKIKRLKAIRTD